MPYGYDQDEDEEDGNVQNDAKCIFMLQDSRRGSAHFPGSLDARSARAVVRAGLGLEASTLALLADAEGAWLYIGTCESCWARDDTVGIAHAGWRRGGAHSLPALELARILKQVAVVVIVRILLLRRRACIAPAAPFEMLVLARYASDTRTAVWARVALQAQALAHISGGRKAS